MTLLAHKYSAAQSTAIRTGKRQNMKTVLYDNTIMTITPETSMMPGEEWGFLINVERTDASFYRTNNTYYGSSWIIRDVKHDLEPEKDCKDTRE